MKQILAKICAVSLVLAGFLPVVAQAAAHAAGTNIKASDGTIYFISSDGTRRPYNSAGAFLSYGFNSWANVKVASSEDLSLPIGARIAPQDGKIMCDTKERVGTCFLMTAGSKIAFTSETHFKQLGFSFSNALYGDVSFMPELQNIQSGFEAHRPGVLINKSGTIYLVVQTGILGIPSMEIFNSWGYNMKDVVTANSADWDFAIVGTLGARNAGELSPVVSPNSQSYTAPVSTLSAYPTASLSVYSPQVTVYTGTSVEVFSFILTAPTNGSLNIKQISIEFGGTVSPTLLSNLKIYDWTHSKVVNEGAPGVALIANSIGMTVVPDIYISNGQQVELAIRADINNLADGTTIQPRLTQVWATNSSGNTDLAVVTGLPLSSPLLSIKNYSSINSYIQKLNVTSPKNGDVLQAGSSKTITWTTTTSSSVSLTIRLLKKNSSGSYDQQQVVATDVPNTGSYNWYVSQSLPTGQYYVLVGNSDYSVSDDSDGDFTINNPSLPQSVNSMRDDKRLADIRMVASALELYFNDKNSYPTGTYGLGQLAPTYIYSVPVAPTPADGTCTSAQNEYMYTSLSNGQSYILTFCLGASTGGYSSGAHVLSPSGIQ